MIVDYIESSDITLEVSVDGGDLVVRAKANRKRVKVGESVTFEAGVFQGPPSATYSFEWDFGDPSGPVTGKRVPYRPELAGVLFAQVAVRNLDPGCTIRCNGTDQVEVEVGEAPEQPEATDRRWRQRHARRRGLVGRQRRRRTGGGAGGGGGAGTNPGGEETESPEPAEEAKPEPKPEPKPPPPPPAKPFGMTISGVLINDTGTTARKLPAGQARRRRRGRPRGAGRRHPRLVPDGAWAGCSRWPSCGSGRFASAETSNCASHDRCHRHGGAALRARQRAAHPRLRRGDRRARVRPLRPRRVLRRAQPAPPARPPRARAGGATSARQALAVNDPAAAQLALMPLASSAQMADTLVTLVDGHDEPGIHDRRAKALADFDLSRCASSNAAACSCASAPRSASWAP